MILAILLHLFAAQHAVVAPTPTLVAFQEETRGYSLSIGDFYLGSPLHLSSIPPQPQTYTGCTVTITNGTVTIVCPATPLPLSITTPVALPPATVGVPYSANVAALVNPQGGIPPYTFKPVDGFPAWSRLSASGMLTGTPVAPCTCVLKFNVTDFAGTTVSATTPSVKGVPLNVQVPQVTGSTVIASPSR